MDSKQLSLTDNIAECQSFADCITVDNNARGALRRAAEKFRELEVALSQQAQPLTDEERQMLADVIAAFNWMEVGSSHTPTREHGERIVRIATHLRDRMRQQAQPEVESITGPTAAKCRHGKTMGQFHYVPTSETRGLSMHECTGPYQESRIDGYVR